MKRTCKQCGKEFFISNSEIEFYKKKNLSFPKRCKECRQLNKENKAKQGDGVNETNEQIVKPAKNESNQPVTDNSIDPKKGIGALGTLIGGAILIFAIIMAVFYFSGDDVNQEQEVSSVTKSYSFRNTEYLDEHYEKHGIEMGFASAEEYEKAACDVINNPEALTKTEKEDGDFVYYVEATNDFVIVSTDGYIRTYFRPDSGKKYYDKQ